MSSSCNRQSFDIFASVCAVSSQNITSARLQKNKSRSIVLQKIAALQEWSNFMVFIDSKVENKDWSLLIGKNPRRVQVPWILNSWGIQGTHGTHRKQETWLSSLCITSYQQWHQPTTPAQLSSLRATST